MHVLLLLFLLICSYSYFAKFGLDILGIFLSVMSAFFFWIYSDFNTELSSEWQYIYFLQVVFIFQACPCAFYVCAME